MLRLGAPLLVQKNAGESAAANGVAAATTSARRGGQRRAVAWAVLAEDIKEDSTYIRVGCGTDRTEAVPVSKVLQTRVSCRSLMWSLMSTRTLQRCVYELGTPGL